MKKPPFVETDAFDMGHVPPPDPKNFWTLPLNESRVIMVDQDASGRLEPILTITVRAIEGERVSLQITANPKMRVYVDLQGKKENGR